jgi:hypothetical protein
VTKAKLFTATFNRMMENIKEINVTEIFVAAVDDIDPEAMFDLRGEISPWYSATGQSPTSTAAKGAARIKPAAIPPSPSPAATTLKRPVLRLPTFRQKCG